MPGPLSRFLAVLRDEAREARSRPLVAAFLLLAFVSLTFAALPNLDLAVSRLFYDPAAGFLDRRYAFVDAIRNAGRILEWAFALGVCVPLLVKLLFPATRLLLRPRDTFFVLASLALGPGLLVNRILKNYWGRARPNHLLDFGGHSTFSPVWWISDQCQRNCSFVSGEAASAFWLMAVVFLVPQAWKRPVGIAALAVAALVSFARIAAGGHFLSDVLIAWLLVLIVLLVLDRLLLQGLPPQFDTAVERRFDAAGRRLRDILGRRVA